jgi:hypothetical protein
MHRRNAANAHQKTHAGAVTATQVYALHTLANPGFLRQGQRRVKAANMNLLAHDQFPQIPFGPAIYTLNILQSNTIYLFHYSFLIHAVFQRKTDFTVLVLKTRRRFNRSAFPG